MAAGQANIKDSSVNSPKELEDRASAAAHAKFAEWGKQDRDQRPRRILMVTLAAGVITVATALVIFLNRC